MGSEVTFYHIEGRAAFASSIRLEHLHAHDKVTIWNRGGNAGSLMVMCGDGMRVVDALLPPEYRAAPEGGKEGNDG